MQKINIYSAREGDLIPVLLIKVLSWKNEAKPERKKKKTVAMRGKMELLPPLEKRHAPAVSCKEDLQDDLQGYFTSCIYNRNYIIQNIIMLSS